ncbi:Pcf11p [Sporobolomyces salmoneus]|uniref:Pcf11p n=1 Tax=Sporobolomyces salmoneus TaxID=183962 RepID=UPI0031820073
MSYPGYPPYHGGANGYQQQQPPPNPYYNYNYAPPPPPSSHYSTSGQRYDGYDYGAYHGYAAPPPPQPPQPQLREGELRPPPDVGVDPNTFRRYFGQQLQGLTFNSKPVITNLTLFAHEHVIRMSGIVTQCFEEHFRQVSPQHILPAFYLLDSISKNIGPPYLALFARFLERVFLSAYHAVDSTTKVKLEELLGTWKTGGSDGGELFRTHDEGKTGGRVQKGIETALFGATGRGGGMGPMGRGRDSAESYNAGVQQLPHAATSGERSGVLFDVRRLLASRLDQVATNPEDQINQGQVVALKKLESLILNTQLTTDQVNQIRTQLAALNPRPVSSSPPPIRPTAVAPPPPVLSPAPPAIPSLSTVLSPPQPQASSVGGVDLSLLSQLSATGALANLFGNGSSTSGTTTPILPAAPKAEGTPVPETKPPTSQNDFDQEDETVRIWQDEIQRLNIELNNSDLAHSRPNVAALLYVSLPLQCQQCGLRLFESKQGKAKMDQHLDWHYTYKRRIREGAARAQGRSWFTKEEDWYTSDNDSSLISFSNPSDPSGSSGSPVKDGNGTSKGGTNVIDRAALLKKKVSVPPAGGLGDKPCPICQDKFKSEWSDEEEEWVWWNAVNVDGILYHATCHAEATLARATAAASALARTNSALASREGTPTLKRKAEEESEAKTAEIKKEPPASLESKRVEGDGGERELKRVKTEPSEES